MAIRTNLKDLKSARDRFKTEITLPSAGYSNPTAFPGGKLTDYPWDIATSEWMAEASKTSEHSFLAKLAQRVTRLSDAATRDLVSSELLLVCMVSRALALPNSSVSYTPTCPHCGTVQPMVTIRIPDALQKEGEKTPDYKGDKVTLPESKDVLTVRPLLVGEVEDVLALPTDLRRGFTDSELTLLTAIRAVNETTPDNFAELKTYFQALSPVDIEFLVLELGRIAPGVSTKIKHKCENSRCEKTFDYLLRLGPDFFRDRG